MRVIKPKQKRTPGCMLLVAMLGLLAVVLMVAMARTRSSRSNAGGLAAGDARVLITDPKAHTAAAGNVQTCNGVAHSEVWGQVVTAGGGAGGLSAQSEAACCNKCHETRGCNIWVWCHEEARCGKQCWLKREASESKFDALQPKSTSPDVPWTSGTVKKDFNRDVASLPALNHAISVVALNTEHGTIRIQLKPTWHQSSVEYVQQVASNPDVCTTQCVFYRAEPGFLLQGSIAAFIPPNNLTQKGPKIMERGEIGWAGGFSGPDFFIYLGTQPATHFGHDHTVWGIVADEESLEIVEKIVALPAKADSPGAMHMLTKTVGITPAVVK